MAALTIAGLARAGGVGVETVRYYQRRKLLQTPDRGSASRDAGSVRRYEDVDVQKLRFIRAAQAAGFTLEQIAELIKLDTTDDRTRARALAIERVAALDLKIAELEKARASLRRLAGECEQGSAGPCPILSSFEQA